MLSIKKIINKIKIIKNKVDLCILFLGIHEDQCQMSETLNAYKRFQIKPSVDARLFTEIIHIAEIYIKTVRNSEEALRWLVQCSATLSKFNESVFLRKALPCYVYFPTCVTWMFDILSTIEGYVHTSVPACSSKVPRKFQLQAPGFYQTHFKGLTSIYRCSTHYLKCFNQLT